MIILYILLFNFLSFLSNYLTFFLLIIYYFVIINLSGVIMVTLIVLDGFGVRKEEFGNAIKAAGTPNLDKLYKKYPFTTLEASGLAVGLPQGQVGNSEVGHLTLGTGRVTLQSLQKINTAIDDGSFFTNKRLIKAFKHAQTNNSSLHLIGMISDGGVHSHINHLYAILQASKKYKIKNIYIHAITDGRDKPERDSINFINDLQEFLQKNQLKNAKIASICGRVYAMDRERDYGRIKLVYDMLVKGQKNNFSSAAEALNASYQNGITDQFVLPCLIEKDGTIKDNDSVIFFNFRTDRIIELTNAFTNKNFKEFRRKPIKNLLWSPMMSSISDFSDLNCLFEDTPIKDSLPAILSKKGLTQLHLTETTKFTHVTFYFGGLNDQPNKNEEWKKIDSVEAEDFTNYPNMRAYEIADAAMEAIASQKYDFVLLNFSNPDMIGHTGNFESAKKAVTCIDKTAYAVALATLMAGGDCIITADHGNIEIMFDKNGNKVLSHTTSLVPCILVSERFKKVKLDKKRSIAAIAPTILKLFGLETPKTMQKPLF